MSNVDVEVEGLATLLARLEAGERRVNLELARAMTDILERLKDRVAKYPKTQSKKPPSMRGKFASDKQRRWFFAALRRGEIQVPYRRRGTLGRKWAVKVKMAPEVVGYLGNVRPYAGYVQDRKNQAKIHQGNWPTVQDVIEDETDFVVEKFERAARIIFEGE